MRDNGTDRDVAQSILGLLDGIKDAVANINANLFSPVILTQPVNATDIGIGDTAQFTVSTANVTAYQWQYKGPQDTNWYSSTHSGNTTDTLSVVATETRYAVKFRCKLTGKDGSIIYTNEVQMIAPES